MTYSELSISECIVNIKTNVIPNNKNGDIFNDHCNDNIIYQKNNILICTKNKTIVKIIIKYPNIYNNNNINCNTNKTDDLITKLL